MPRSGYPTRKHILDAAYTLFRRKGYTRVSMDEIAAAAMVTKRTLYYHFRSKDDLLAVVLEEQHDLAVAAFRTFGDKLVGSPLRIVDALFKELAAWADKPRWAGSGFTRLVVELADMPGHPARRIARQHKMVLETQLGKLFAKSGVKSPQARARDIYLLTEGAIAMLLIHGDRKYARAAALAGKRLLQPALKKRLSRRDGSRLAPG
jgi:AcrR family transcriptional regulator